LPASSPLSAPRNVIGTVLQPCSLDPLTGWHRDGCCRSGAGDLGVHVVCVRVSSAFLAFSKSRGNDLGTPHPEWGEQVRAVVECVEGRSVSATGLLEFLRDKLAGYKRPRAIDIVHEIPRNPAG